MYNWRIAITNIKQFASMVCIKYVGKNMFLERVIRLAIAWEFRQGVPVLNSWIEKEIISLFNTNRVQAHVVPIRRSYEVLWLMSGEQRAVRFCKTLIYAFLSCCMLSFNKSVSFSKPFLCVPFITPVIILRGSYWILSMRSDSPCENPSQTILAYFISERTKD